MTEFMTLAAKAGHDGFLHEAVFYDSDEEFLAIVGPFLVGGRRAGEPTLVATGPAHAELLRASLDLGPSVTFLSSLAWDAGPAAMIKAFHGVVAERLVTGDERVRLVMGDTPQSRPGARWEQWGRFEAAINHAFGDLPLWLRCTFDRESTPRSVIDEVISTHPHIATGGHLARNPGFTDPTRFLRHRASTYRDPLEASVPIEEMIDPNPVAARSAARRAGATAGLSASDTADLLVAISEAVTNGHLHGSAPVTVRLWAGRQRVVVTVNDQGVGPEDPCVGFLPPETHQRDGRGLWIINQLEVGVTMSTNHDGFTIRLIAGDTSGAI